TKDSMNHLVISENQEEAEEVLVMRLEDEVGSIPFAMGKVDIEGAELPAMRGAVRMLEAHNPPVWLLETNNLCHRYGYTREELIRFLGLFGYRLAVYDADANRLQWAEDVLRSQQNILAIAEVWRAQVESRLGSKSSH